MSSYVVVDLDGTLCDCTHREHHAQNREWDEFHSKLHLDEPNKDVRMVVEALSEYGATIIACTGRPHKYRAETLKWIAQWEIPIDDLLMRPDEDFRSDVEIKLDLLMNRINGDKEAVTLILEDREKVIEMWRNNGFRCWAVTMGAY